MKLSPVQITIVKARFCATHVMDKDWAENHTHEVASVIEAKQGTLQLRMYVCMEQALQSPALQPAVVAWGLASFFSRQVHATAMVLYLYVFMHAHVFSVWKG